LKQFKKVADRPDTNHFADEMVLIWQGACEKYQYIIDEMKEEE